MACKAAVRPRPSPAPGPRLRRKRSPSHPAPASASESCGWCWQRALQYPTCGLTDAATALARYACGTVHCTKLVHNAAMILASAESAPFDAAEIFTAYCVEGNEMEKLKKMTEDELSWGKRWSVKYTFDQ